MSPHNFQELSLEMSQLSVLVGSVEPSTAISGGGRGQVGGD